MKKHNFDFNGSCKDCEVIKRVKKGLIQYYNYELKIWSTNLPDCIPSELQKQLDFSSSHYLRNLTNSFKIPEFCSTYRERNLYS